MEAIAEVLADVMKKLDALRGTKAVTRPRGLQTGLGRVDELTDGLQAGRVHVVAGRAGMGVSTLIRTMVLGVLADGGTTLFFTVGDQVSQEAIRFLTAASHGQSIRHFEKAQFNDKEWFKSEAKARQLSDYPLFFDSTDDFSEIIQLVVSYRERHPDRKILVVLENSWCLRLINYDNHNGMGKQLVDIAKELNLAIIVASRMNLKDGLKAYRRNSPLPKISSIASNQGVVESADVVITIEREEFYSQDALEKGVAWVNVIRNHQGPTGSGRFVFLGDISVVDNINQDVKINPDLRD